MISRFYDTEGKRRLIDCLQRQRIVQGAIPLAERLADVVTLIQFDKGDELIQQGGLDTDLLFIIAGRVSIQVHGREVALRTAGQHVGEMALIDTTAARAASVVALEITVVGAIPEPEFATIAAGFPNLWRYLAIELCERLRQRNALVRPVNPRPFVFIGSSSESLPVAAELRSGLDCPEILVRLWTDGGVFGASRFPIESLTDQTNASDFAVLAIGPDDKVVCRGVNSHTPRDNVVFELGFFMGALSRERTFIVAPFGVDIKVPTDLLGLTQLRYDQSTAGGLPVAVRSICDEIKRIIFNQGPR